jgi:hypothetical protein
MTLTRRRLPARRESTRHTLKIGGHTVHITVSFYAGTNEPGEVFVDMQKEGTALRVFAHAFAIVLSIGLQHGVPVATVVHALRGLAGEPCGTVEGHATITEATSIVDLVAQVLVAHVGTEHPRTVYLAGGSSERLTVCQPLVDRLLAAGVRVAYDWTRDPGWSVPDPDLARAARRDLAAVREAAIVWYVAPERASEGSAAELGAALALGKRVIVSGEHARAPWRIFPLLGEEFYPSHEDALRAVLALTGGAP